MLCAVGAKAQTFNCDGSIGRRAGPSHAALPRRSAGRPWRGCGGPSVRARGRGAVLQAPSGPGDAVGVGVGRGAGVHVSRGALVGAGRGVAAGGAGVLGGCDFTGGFVWADPLQGGFVWGPPRADWAEMGFGAPPKCPLAPSCPTPQGAVWRPPILFSPAGPTDYRGGQAPGGSGKKPSVEAVQLKFYFEKKKSGS